MINIMQGDAYRVPIRLYSDGADVTAEMLSDLEICIGGIRKLMSGGEISYSGGAFYIELTQGETFRLRGIADIIARLKFVSGDVIGVKVDEIRATESKSKVVL